MKKEFTRKLEIVLDEYTNQYELWLHFYNYDDTLYPLVQSLSLMLLDSLEALKDYSKKNYSDIYNPHTIFNYSRKNN